MRSLLLATLTLPVAALAGGPSLSIGGACPGTIDVMAEGFVPGTTVAVLSGSGLGRDAVPGGPCAGASSDLSGLSLITLVPADGAGRISVSPSVSGPVCSLTIQMLDTTTCLFTNTDTVAGGGGGGIIVAEGRGGGFGTELGVIDPVEGTYTTLNPATGYPLTGLSFGPDGRLYGVQASSRSFPFIFDVDPETGDLTILSSATDPGSFSAFSHGADGGLYGWTENGDDFISIDPLSGDVEVVPVGIGTLNNCMALAPDGTLYMFSGSAAYAFDPRSPADYASLGLVSGLGTGSGGSCTFHEGELYKFGGGALHRIDLRTMTAEVVPVAGLPDGIDAMASATP